MTLSFWKISQIKTVEVKLSLVFMKVLEDLENMIKSKKQLKGSSRNKPTLLFEDEDFLFYFLTLLFTEKEKNLIYEQLTETFGQE